MAMNTDIPDEQSMSAEEMAIWNQEEDPSFEELRASLGDDEQEQETENNTDTTMEQSTDFTEDSDIDAAEEDEDITATEDVIEKDNQSDEEVVEETKSNVDMAQKYKVKANGMEFEFSNEELVALAPKAMDYTKKMQEIAPYRKSLSAMKEAGLSHDDLNLAIDVLKGDKGALAEVAKRTGIDLDTLETETEDTNYVPNQYGKDEHQLAIEDVVNQISIDPEYQITQQVVDSTWDSGSRQYLAQKPQMILGLHNDIKSGVYDKVAPLAFKMKALDGGSKSDLEYYVEAGQKYFTDQGQNSSRDNDALTSQADEVNKAIEKNTNVANQSKNRKAASITKSNSGKRDIVDYLNDDDSSFDEWYKNVKANQ